MLGAGLSQNARTPGQMDVAPCTGLDEDGLDLAGGHMLLQIPLNTGALF